MIRPQGGSSMKKEHCEEEMDYLNHYLNEQITRICVIEEDERMREELDKKIINSNMNKD